MSPISPSLCCPTPSLWEPLICSLYLWVSFFFVISRSLLYFLDFTYKWYDTVFVFLSLTYFTSQHNALQVHPCCFKWQGIALLYGWAALHCASACVRCYSSLWLSRAPLCVCVCEMLSFFRTEQHSLVRLRVWDVVLYDWAALHCVSVCVTISSTIISWWTLGLFPYLGNCECAINIRVHVSFQISFRLLLDIYPGVEFLGHTVILFLVFWETTILFSTVTVPV